MNGTVDYSELINAAKSGDGSAFDELYKLTVKASYCTASLLLSNSCDVEDVLQNAYLKAFQKLPELKKPESFDSWMKTIVENECKNYIKKEQRIYAPIVFLKNRDEEHSEEWDQPIPQEYIEREELRKKVSDILDRLSPEVRACIVLFHYDDKSLDEIKDILDIPLGTVKSRLHHGRKEIEREFGKLRKKDPTLYGIGAIPAVLSLLAFRAKNIVVPAAIADASVSATVSAVSAASGAAAASGTAAVSGSAAASGTAAASAGTGSAAASTVGAASTAAVSIGVKIAAVAVAGSVAVGGTVAIKDHIDSKPPGDTTSYATTAGYEETHTAQQALAEMTTEISTTASTAESTTNLTTAKTTAALSQMITSAQTTAAQTKKQVSTKKSTTLPQTTVTTAKQTATTSTTAKLTTTATTTAKTTAAKTTVTEEETTARQQTTNPENNYGASGGVITEYKGSDSSVSIPSSVGSTPVTAIGSGAFSGNTSIKSVTIPSSVTQIGQEAFADCTSLSSVSLPSSLEAIGIGAFYGCSSLTSVTIPDGTKSIGDEAFAQCTSLQTVTIPESVTSIAADAFDGCDSVTIRCKEGSAAHEFAIAESVNYSLI